MRKHLLPTLAVLTAGSFAFACSDSPSDSDEGVAVAATSQSLSGAAKAGQKLFNEGIPGTPGNGRVCATCHVSSDGFGLSPATVESRFQKLQSRRAHDPSADDPLFRSLDANDGASDFTNLRQHALIRIEFKLPTDADGNKLMWPVDDPSATSVSVWRGVPTINNTAITAPYQQDGRFATLQIQADAAFSAHSAVNGASAGVLDAITAFEKGSFSSPRVGKISAAITNNQPIPSADPDDLTAEELHGKALFEHHCTSCHGGPAQNVIIPGIGEPGRNIFVSKPVPPFAADLPYDPSPVAPRLWAFRVPGGDPVIIPSTDPGKALTTGNVADLSLFDVPALYGIGKTAPYFHDNSAATLEAVIKLYQLDFIALRRVVPDFVPFPIRPDILPDEDVAPLVAYLKKI